MLSQVQGKKRAKILSGDTSRSHPVYLSLFRQRFSACCRFSISTSLGLPPYSPSSVHATSSSASTVSFRACRKEPGNKNTGEAQADVYCLLFSARLSGFSAKALLLHAGFRQGNVFRRSFLRRSSRRRNGIRNRNQRGIHPGYIQLTGSGGFRADGAHV